MFKSATLKLTAWYLAILMAISLLFSFVIYQLNFHEVTVRLENLQQGYFAPNVTTTIPEAVRNQLRLEQINQASVQMILTLLYINLGILVAGGLGSYWLARRTLEPIELALEAQTRFTSDASHELRTPLATMRAELEVMLRDKVLDPADTRELLESNLEEVNKLIALSEMLLKLARLDHDTLEKKSLNLSSTLQDVIAQMPDAAQRIDVTARNRVMVYGNEPAINELLQILIQNAVKYSPDSSEITIKIAEHRMVTTCEITNQSAPLSKDQLEHLFDRFYRADRSRTKGYHKGYGLGLAIAKRIVEIHNGELKASYQKGSFTASFSLPSLRNIQVKRQSSQG
jgi:two-component system sensor histidine kinase CiaH